MTALPDPGRSRAVLIGSSTYRHLEDLPAVHNNLVGLCDVLTNSALGGLPAGKCTVLENPRRGLDVYRVLHKNATAAEDTLLVYFSGHGRTGDRNELYLCLPGTDPDVLSFTALAYNDLRRAVAEGRATKKVVVLDCCFSGRALSDLAGGDETIVGQVGIEGSYILTATPANAVALAPPGERYTAFTGALLDLLRTGIPSGRELLTFSEIYPRLRYTLTSRQLPQPRQRGSDTIADLALTRNPAYKRPVPPLPARSPDAVAITPAPLPEALAADLDSSDPAVRIGAVNALGEWLTGDDPTHALTAEQRLQQIVDTDIPAVADVARARLLRPSHHSVPIDPHARDVRSGVKPVAEANHKAPELAREDTPAPAQDDRTPTARLLADAERAALSIADKTSMRRWALRDVAVALAATDPDGAVRVARLNTDEAYEASALRDVAVALVGTDSDRAVSIAQSNGDKWKTLALHAVVQKLAATDPDRAERTAQLITDPGGRAWALRTIAVVLVDTDPDRAEHAAQSATDPNEKVSALSDIAAALAATDPDRATRLSAAAEQVAQSITDEHLKASALHHVAVALAGIDPGRAERTAQSIPYEWKKASALHDVAVALAATDPRRAERTVRLIADRAERASALHQIAVALAATDPDRAERTAESITDLSEKVSALSDIAATLAAIDPDRATHLFTAAERAALSATDPSEKASALKAIAVALAATDPGRAVRFFGAAIRTAQSIANPSSKVALLSAVAQELAATHWDHAARLATLAENIASQSITDPQAKIAALVEIAKIYSYKASA